MADAKADGPWLHAWYDPVAGLKTFTQLIRMVDMTNENDCRLLVADQDKKLRVYRGTGVSSIHPLIDTPAALAVVYADSALPRTPSVAVASGPFVYVYRNLRPYMKFSLPNLPLTFDETNAWDALYTGQASISDTVHVLAGLRDTGILVSSRALDFLVMQAGKEREEFVESTRGKPLVQQTVVTCMEAFCTEREGPGEASTLVLGTEARSLVFLDGSSAGIEYAVDLPSVPVQICVYGIKKGEHRINVLCRDGGVYAVRDKQLLPTRLDCGALPIAIARTEQEVVLASMDCRITAFQPKGKKAWSVALPAAPTALCRMLIKRDRILDCVAVACEGGLIRVFLSGSPVADLLSPDTVVAMRYGQYGREANTLAFVTRNGSLAFKMLRRTASFDVPSDLSSAPSLPEADVPLPVPKKTRLYLEQVGREKESPADMHKLFQRDMVKLRLHTAKAYVKSLKDGGTAMLSASASSTAGAGGPALSLTAAVLGLGPRFRVRLELQNVGTTSVADVGVLMLFAHAVYSCGTPCMQIPLLLPGCAHVLHVPILCVDEGGAADVIRVHVSVPPNALPSGTEVWRAIEGVAGGTTVGPLVPSITAMINMPLSLPPQPIV